MLLTAQQVVGLLSPVGPKGSLLHCHNREYGEGITERIDYKRQGDSLNQHD